MSWEVSILYWIQETLRGPVMDYINFGLTYLAEKGIVPILVCLILIAMKKTRKIGIFCAVVLAASALVNSVIIKNIVCRPRPYTSNTILHPLVLMKDYSFPSGHTCAAFAIFFGLKDFVDKKYAIILCVLACLVAFSRMYLGVHYPTDVLCGALVAFITYLVVKKLMPEQKPE
ncbi:MAG: phosphatase PAP2 family protein [Holdemanella sp.]|nr:phosphatase PAP2 family protein [Holdemanella sp.]